ncbi:MAG: serine hydrolase domain-containing protein [Thermoanaerobaculia bacterium]
MSARAGIALGLWAGLSLIGFEGLLTAQESETKSSLELQIDEIVAPYLAARDFMGVVAVQQGDEAALILPYGLANAELDVPHQPSDIFMIGSVSKQFTAAAVLLLEQDGLLRTDDPVSKHLPGFAHGDEIAIEQLLTHTSGVADIYSLERFGDSAGQGGTFEEVIADLGEMDLTHPPGAAYAYSNGGYSLLAAIIERASGATYGEYLERRIFKPLGMGSTAHDTPGPVVRHRVPGYDPWGPDNLTRVTPISAAFSTGSGSLWSSAADLLVWSTALHNGEILGDEAYRKLVHDYGHGYGYGVSVFRRFGRDVLGHDGRVAGYASDVARYLDDRVSILVLSNVQSVARDEIRRWVAAAVFGEPYSVPPQRRYSDLQDVPIDDLVGVYSFGSALSVTLIESDERLLARANEGGYSELIPVSETEWFSRLLYTTVRFGRDDEGSIDRLLWGPGDQPPSGRRMR